MTMGLELHLLLLVINIKGVVAFYPNPLSDIDLGKDTLTHLGITEQGILRAVAAFFEETPRPGSTIAKGELTGMDKITARKLFDRYYGPDASVKRFTSAIDEIIFSNNIVDIAQEKTASWHFNGEEIIAANVLMIDIREKIIDIFKSTNPNLDEAIELTGQYLHILQMFYSNTNWVEISGAVPYYSLGIRGKPLFGTAPAPMDTCRSCWDNNQGTCRDNLIIAGQMLTSGYRSGQEPAKPNKDPRMSMTGKCSHGGRFDESGKTVAALGGINKDANTVDLSPHHHLHAAAAQAAIAHTTYFFEDKEYGLRRAIGDSNYQKLLKLRAGSSMALVIDYSGSMSQEIEAVKTQIADIIGTASGTINEPSSYIVSLFNDPLNLNSVKQFDTSEAALAYLKTVKVNGGGDCPEYAMDGIEKALTLCQPNSKLYVFTDASAKDPEKTPFLTTLAAKKKVKIDFLLTGDCSRRRRSIQTGNDIPLVAASRTKRQTGMDVFKTLAKATGGTVYVTDKSEIAEVADVIKESALSSTVIVMRRTVTASETLNFTFPVDSSVQKVIVKIVTPGGAPSQTLVDPNGRSNTGLSVKDVGNGIRFITIESPVFGDWRLLRQDTNSWDIEISAESTLDISVNFVVKNPRNGFEYKIIGRPVAGDNAALIASLPSLEMVKSLDAVILLDSTGSEFVRHDGFTQIGGSESSLFRRQFELPGNLFHIALSGTDNDGHEFLRLVAENIVPVYIQLKILSVNGSFYINERLSVPFEVTNKGDATSTIVVSINDDQNFAQAPKEYTFELGASESEGGEFWLQAGPTERITTTATFSAKVPTSDAESYQFVVRHFSTTKRIVRETDMKDPVCEITKITGTCDVGIIDPCFCSQNEWFATTEVGDDGFGLFQVTSTIVSEGSFSVENFTMGHNIKNGTIQANISATCCDAIAYINVVDMAGNIGQCVFNVITEDGETVTNSSIMDMVKSRNKCVTSTAETQTTSTIRFQDATDVTVRPGAETRLSIGVIVGIAIGVTAFIIILAVAIVLVVKKKKASKGEMTVSFVDK